MIHKMKLNEKPFNLMKKGKKTIELRLNDEKRQNVKIGDIIVFSKAGDETEQIKAEVIGIHKFRNFKELYESLPLEKCGYDSEEIPIASHKDMEEYYSLEQQAKFGVLGIEITMI